MATTRKLTKRISYGLGALIITLCSLMGMKRPAWAEEVTKSKEKAKAVKVLLNDLVEGTPQGLSEDQLYILSQAVEILNNYSTSTVDTTDAVAIEQQPKQPNAMVNAAFFGVQPQQANAMIRSFTKVQPQQANAMLKLQPQ